jgi:hypothetical protein
MNEDITYMRVSLLINAGFGLTVVFSWAEAELVLYCPFNTCLSPPITTKL